VRLRAALPSPFERRCLWCAAQNPLTLLAGLRKRAKKEKFTRGPSMADHGARGKGGDGPSCEAESFPPRNTAEGSDSAEGEGSQRESRAGESASGSALPSMLSHGFAGRRKWSAPLLQRSQERFSHGRKGSVPISTISDDELLNVPNERFRSLFSSSRESGRGRGSPSSSGTPSPQVRGVRNSGCLAQILFFRT
jgi:hypothetical protein